ncbi:MAG TPA: HlyD family efflux transporter periplasmic adaptor subunit, partial [Kofleriaceae bacterium]|nr:HlyD family efflux transporter periplasmic adaptor subunit [Kofleriaceae bacterium]
MKRKIIVSTLALTLGLTGWMVVRRGRAAVVQVEAGEIHETIIAQGQVVATAGDADVRALVDGRVVEVAVREGDSVTAGQLLAKIDTQEIDAAIARAEAQEEVAKAELAVAQAGGRVEEKHAAQAALDEAQANLALEESRATRDTALADQGAIPSATADDSRRTAAIAKAKVARAMAERNSTLRGREEAIEAARARVAEADAELTAARARRERAIVVAPIDGVVLARHVDAGDGVTPGAVMFELADAGATELRVEIEESDALRVTVGLDVDVTTSGGHDVIGHGTVARISPRLATRTIGANEARMRAETQVRSVWIRWTDKSALPIGMRVEARVKLPAKKVAARVPRSSVLVR